MRIFILQDIRLRIYMAIKLTEVIVMAKCITESCTNYVDRKGEMCKDCLENEKQKQNQMRLIQLNNTIEEIEHTIKKVKKIRLMKDNKNPLPKRTGGN